MPFDATPTIDNPLTFSPGKEGLRKLAILLRREMPQKFEWKFHELYEHEDAGCGTTGCALGLAAHVWGRQEKRCFLTQGENIFDIPDYVHDMLFMEGTIYGKAMRKVTPADVADAIDRYLSTGKV